MEWPGAVYADGKDHVGRDCGAGRVVLASRVTGDRAPRVRARRGELEALKAVAQQRGAAGQLELALGPEPAGGGPLPITSSRMGHLLDALEHAYRVLGWKTSRAGRGVPAPGAGEDHRAGGQAGQPAGP